MHLPDEDLGRLDRGDPLPTGRCEAHGVTLTQRPRTLEVDGATGHEQVQIGGIRQLDGLARLEPGRMQRGMPVADADGRRVGVGVYPRGDGGEPPLEVGVVDLELLDAGGSVERGLAA